MISTRRTLFLLLLLLSMTVSVAAQTYRGSIRGTVTDPNNAVIPAAHSNPRQQGNQRAANKCHGRGRRIRHHFPSPGSYTHSRLQRQTF